MSGLSDYLGITEEELDELEIELLPDDGSSGEMVYSYYFYVPDTISNELSEQTGWVPGEVVRMPAYVIDNDIDEAELEWIRQSEQSKRFDQLIFDLNHLRNKVSDSEFYNSKIELRMVYSYSVTLFEAFLSETAKHVISNNKDALREAVSYFSSLEKAQQFNLMQIMDFDILKYVLSKTANLTFHNIDTAHKFLTKILFQNIDLSSLAEIIRNRHDIVHRNGKTIKGDEIELSVADVQNAITAIEHVAESIFEIADKLDEL